MELLWSTDSGDVYLCFHIPSIKSNAKWLCLFQVSFFFSSTKNMEMDRNVREALSSSLIDIQHIEIDTLLSWRKLRCPVAYTPYTYTYRRIDTHYYVYLHFYNAFQDTQKKRLQWEEVLAEFGRVNLGKNRKNNKGKNGNNEIARN